MAWLRFRLGQRPHHNRLSLWRITSIWSSSPSRRTSRPPRIAISATGSLRMLRRVPFEALVHFFLKSLENSSILHETTEILQNWYGSWLALLPLLIQSSTKNYGTPCSEILKKKKFYSSSLFWMLKIWGYLTNCVWSVLQRQWRGTCQGKQFVFTIIILVTLHSQVPHALQFCLNPRSRTK